MDKQKSIIKTGRIGSAYIYVGKIIKGLKSIRPLITSWRWREHEETIKE